MVSTRVGVEGEASPAWSGRIVSEAARSETVIHGA